MGKTRRASGAAGRLEALVELGDHAGARAEARRILAAADSPEPDREAAAGLLRGLQPDGGAVGVGLSGLALASAILAWLLTG